MFRQVDEQEFVSLERLLKAAPLLSFCSGDGYPHLPLATDPDIIAASGGEWYRF
jgi:hypothetical protein